MKRPNPVHRPSFTMGPTKLETFSTDSVLPSRRTFHNDVECTPISPAIYLALSIPLSAHTIIAHIYHRNQRHIIANAPHSLITPIPTKYSSRLETKKNLIAPLKAPQARKQPSDIKYRAPNKRHAAYRCPYIHSHRPRAQRRLEITRADFCINKSKWAKVEEPRTAPHRSPETISIFATARERQGLFLKCSAARASPCIMSRITRERSFNFHGHARHIVMRASGAWKRRQYIECEKD